MAIAIHKTTREVRRSVDLVELERQEPSQWVPLVRKVITGDEAEIVGNLAAVEALEAVEPKYRVVEGDTARVVTRDERAAVDSAEAAAQVTANRQAAERALLEPSDPARMARDAMARAERADTTRTKTPAQLKADAIAIIRAGGVDG